MAGKLRLQSADGHLFHVDEEVAFMSITVKNLVEDAGLENAIPLPEVDASTLAKVIAWCKYHAAADKKDAVEIEKFEADLLADKAAHVGMTMASNYLNINGLMDVCCKKWADMIKGRTPEEIRTLFNLEDDLTEEEKKKIMAETVWKFE
ncbi:hypothetical protein HYH03_001660 [Edaphochlamys debaryana]|uniref:SKP1-like protein n=1 Tax=Edaphochlamys debaryana TaxID=47281 RepID=A0A835YH81_9CHLO|nr:hypothetical protein HYH03_001660 [Edaphochlamys debaryana]|eukprot:KAG2500901.1 hypothetical protein HYH03_001660 [Edaphochlamys debaryana]